MQTELRCLVRPDFASRLGRQTEPQIKNPEVLKLQAERAALLSIAFSFLNSDEKKLTALGLETAMLALYAAGAPLALTRSDLFGLSGELRRYLDLYQLFELRENSNGKILRFVFNQAMLRAHRESIASGSRADLPLGFKLIKLGSSSESDPADSQEALMALAFTLLHPDPIQVSEPKLSLAMLAIWNAGAQVEMEADVFARLCLSANLMLQQAELSGKLSGAKLKQLQEVLGLARVRALKEGLSVAA